MTVHLRTGVEAGLLQVSAALVVLEALAKEAPEGLLALQRKAHDRDFEIPPEVGARLRAAHLLTHEGELRDCLREVVLAAVTGTSAADLAVRAFEDVLAPPTPPSDGGRTPMTETETEKPSDGDPTATSAEDAAAKITVLFFTVGRPAPRKDESAQGESAQGESAQAAAPQALTDEERVFLDSLFTVAGQVQNVFDDPRTSAECRRVIVGAWKGLGKHLEGQCGCAPRPTQPEPTQAETPQPTQAERT